MEWNRRAKQVDWTKEELEIDVEWLEMQKNRKERSELRKKMYWEAIYTASIPIGITRLCRKCKAEFKFGHIENHVGEKEKDLIGLIEEIVRGEGSLKKIIGLNRKTDIISVWNTYSKLFVNKRSNTTIEEFLSREEVGEKDEFEIDYDDIIRKLYSR